MTNDNKEKLTNKYILIISQNCVLIINHYELYD